METNKMMSVLGSVTSIRVLGVILALLLPGCAGRNIKAAYVKQIMVASDIHRDTMTAVGKAYKRGMINDSQLAVFRVSGKTVEVSLRASKEALSGYLKGESTLSQLSRVLSVLQDDLAELLQSWEEVLE